MNSTPKILIADFGSEQFALGRAILSSQHNAHDQLRTRLWISSPHFPPMLWRKALSAFANGLVFELGVLP